MYLYIYINLSLATIICSRELRANIDLLIREIYFVRVQRCPPFLLSTILCAKFFRFFFCQFLFSFFDANLFH